MTELMQQMLMRQMTLLQRKAYRRPFSQNSGNEPAIDVLPSGEVLGLSINK